MRHHPLPPALLPGVLAILLGAAPCLAQTAEPPSGGDAPAQETQRPAAKPKTKPAKPSPATAKPQAAHDKPKPASLPAVPATAPPAPSLPPPLIVPARPMPPPVPAAVVADAAGVATAEKDGLRITFGVGSSELNPATDTAIRALVRAAPPFASTTFSIVAVAPGTDEDPSTPRRLSLARALAVRSVLITEGIPSERIYVRAMGAAAPALAGGPPDRADLTVGGGAGTAAATTAQGKTQ